MLKRFMVISAFILIILSNRVVLADINIISLGKGQVKEITLSNQPTTLSKGILSLVVPSSLRLWDDIVKTKQITVFKWDLSKNQIPPQKIYVEGLTASQNIGDIQLKYIFTVNNKEITSHILKFTIYSIEIIKCPSYFVPGHANTIKYKLQPTTFVPDFAKIEIYERNNNGIATGQVIATINDTSLDFSNDHSLTYNGTAFDDNIEKYILIIKVGYDTYNCSIASAQFNVISVILDIFFYGELTDEDKQNYINKFPNATAPYRPAIDVMTVTDDTVSMSYSFWDDANNTFPNTVSGVAKSTIGDTTWPQEYSLIDKNWYDDRGAVRMELTSYFYIMSEEGQYYKLKINVSDGGVVDTIGNEFDANPDTQVIEKVKILKFKINSNLEVIEVP
jgi:hypothetical protein